MNNDLAFILKTLKYFDGWNPGRSNDSLYWYFAEDGQLNFCLNCNDLFWWATADSEDITPDNFHLLDEAWKKLQSDHDKIYYFTNLFASMSRKMRPQRPAMKNMPDYIRELFLACGPERDQKEEG